MPSRAEIVSFVDSVPPPGAGSWVPGAAPATGIEVTDPDPAWPRRYDDLAGRIRAALGWRVLQLEQQVVREIYYRAFVAAGLVEE
jgi:hypothetical protein